MCKAQCSLRLHSIGVDVKETGCGRQFQNVQTSVSIPRLFFITAVNFFLSFYTLLSWSFFLWRLHNTMWTRTCGMTMFRRHSQFKVWWCVCVCVCVCPVVHLCLLPSFSLSPRRQLFRTDIRRAHGNHKNTPCSRVFMHHQLHHKYLRRFSSHTIRVPRMILSTNIDYFPHQHWLFVLCNAGGVCSLRSSKLYF